MFQENVIKYIRAGCEPVLEDKFFNDQCKGLFVCTAFMATVPGIVLKGYFLLITILLYIANIVSAIALYKHTGYRVSHKTYLKAKVILCLSWVFEWSLLVLMCFAIGYGFRATVILLYVPVVATPLTMGYINYRKLKKPIEYNPKSKSTRVGSVGMVGFWSGMVITNVVRAVFGNVNVEQNTAIAIVLICFSIVNTAKSRGLVDIQRIYFMKKYNITFDPETVN